MSLSGMTGFARAEGAVGDVRWLWEARSVNGRTLDFKLRLPLGFDRLEAPARELAQARFKRGSLQVSLSLRREAQRAGPRIDLAAIEALIAAGRPLVEAGLVAPPRLDGLLQVRGVLVGGDEPEAEAPEARAALEAALLAGLEAALEGLAAARLEEGAVLLRLMGGLVDQIGAGADAARTLATTQPQAILQRIQARMAALAQEVVVDPQRLAQEAALIAARADVQEELDRLGAHAAEARTLLAGAGPVGRRFEFLTQELMREANTLSAKSNDLALTRAALDLKTAIDQLKEQAANVE